MFPLASVMFTLKTLLWCGSRAVPQGASRRDRTLRIGRDLAAISHLPSSDLAPFTLCEMGRRPRLQSSRVRNGERMSPEGEPSISWEIGRLLYCCRAVNVMRESRTLPRQVVQEGHEIEARAHETCSPNATQTQALPDGLVLSQRSSCHWRRRWP